MICRLCKMYEQKENKNKNPDRQTYGKKTTLFFRKKQVHVIKTKRQVQVLR